MPCPGVETLDRLAAWNPWWRDGRVPEALTGRPREGVDALLEDLEGPRAVVLSGIRRSGKTTLMYQMVAGLLARGVDPQRVFYANLEDIALHGVSLEEMASAHRQALAPEPPRYLLLDEVQMRPEWPRFARVLVDRKADRLAVTGSTASLLDGDAGRLLTGRHLTTQVRPLGFGGFLAFHDVAAPASPVTAEHADALVHHLDRFLRLGGFPQPNVEDPARARRTLHHYFTDILQRDLVASRGLDASNVLALGTYLAKAFARPHSKSSLQRATGLSRNAVRDYVEALRTAYVLQPCTRFSWSPKPAVAEQAPVKYYLADPGLREAVAGPGDLGRLAENAVANALHARGLPLHYWKERHEVDFVVPRLDGRVDALQVTYGEEVPERETGALRALRDQLPAARRGTFLVLTRTEQRLDEHSMPLWRWLLDDGEAVRAAQEGG